MLKTLSITATLLFVGMPAVAQVEFTTGLDGSIVIGELAATEAPPTIVGDLLIHSGTFAAERFTGASDECPVDDVSQRGQTVRVWFDPTYVETPQVIVALNKFEFAQGRNPRIAVGAVGVNPYYMTLVVSTWCDTILYSAAGTYTVIGEIGDGF